MTKKRMILPLTVLCLLGVATTASAVVTITISNPQPGFTVGVMASGVSTNGTDNHTPGTGIQDVEIEFLNRSNNKTAVTFTDYNYAGQTSGNWAGSATVTMRGSNDQVSINISYRDATGAKLPGATAAVNGSCL